MKQHLAWTLMGIAIVGCKASTPSGPSAPLSTPPAPSAVATTSSAEPTPAPTSKAPPLAAKSMTMKLGGRAKIANNELVIPGKITFENDKATIKEDKVTKEVLDTLLATLKDNPSITKLRIEGYTDDQGAIEHNTKLSQDRADAVSMWLQARGIEPGRLLTAGLGPAKPLVDNDSDEHREQNRRTEFKIWEQDGQPTPASQVPDPPPPAPAPTAPKK